MKTFKAFMLLFIIVIGTTSTYASNVYYGLLHAHTSFSDGVGTPEEAFKRAKNKGVDFFAVTPHNHSAAEKGAKDRTDGVLIATNHELYSNNTKITYQNDDGDSFTEKSLLQAAKDKTSADFLPIYGQEFSSISKGNHVNVFNVNSVITIPNGNFTGLIEHLNSLPNKEQIIVQLNHPSVYKDLFYSGSSSKEMKKMNNDYGIDEVDGEFSRLVQMADRYFNLIEIITGPAMKKNEIPNYHYHRNHGDDYYFYLSQGFHISPSVGHDNHYKTWGNTTDARMGIISPSLSLSDVTSAFKSHKTFATEDSGAAITFKVNGHDMGSAISLAPDDDLVMEVVVTDSNETHKSLEIELVYGTIEPQYKSNYQMLRLKSGVQEKISGKQLGTKIKINGYVASGNPEFFFIRAEQEDGDRIWSAPIWINHPKQNNATSNSKNNFVWTKNKSKYYHRAWCRSSKNIKVKNRMTSTVAPMGRELHNCKHSANEVEH